MYVVLSPLNIYAKQNRVCGHRLTPTSTAELRKLTDLAPRLKELGISQIVCSDLDGQAGEMLGRRLNVPVRELESLRRFNFGKWHGAKATRAYEARPVGGDPQVPVKGGDSQASFRKRCAAATDRLRKLDGTVLLIADAEVLERITGARGAEHYHVYEITLEQAAHA